MTSYKFAYIFDNLSPNLYSFYYSCHKIIYPFPQDHEIIYGQPFTKYCSWKYLPIIISVDIVELFWRAKKFIEILHLLSRAPSIWSRVFSNLALTSLRWLSLSWLLAKSSEALAMFSLKCFFSLFNLDSSSSLNHFTVLSNHELSNSGIRVLKSLRNWIPQVFVHLSIRCLAPNVGNTYCWVRGYGAWPLGRSGRDMIEQ